MIGMRIAVLGAGGVGAYFGALLARADEDVTLLARGAQLQALRARPLEVSSVLSGDFSVTVRAVDDPQAIGPVDVVLLCVKSYDTHGALPLVAPLLGPNTVTLSLQNGLGGFEALVALAGRDRVLGSVAYINSCIEAPGRVVHRSGPNRIVFGEIDGGASARVSALHEVLRKAGIAAEISRDVMVSLWEKLAVICGYSGVLALTRQTIGVVREDAETRALLRETMAEVVALAQRRGVALPDDLPATQLAYLDRFEPHARSSMDRDLETGRPLEVEALNGWVVRQGRELGVPTPANFAIYAALRPFVHGRALPQVADQRAAPPISSSMRLRSVSRV